MTQTVLPLYPFDPKYQGDDDGFTFDLRAWLGDQDQISGTPAATITPNDVTIESVFTSGGYVTVWLSGGMPNQTYTLQIQVQTTGTPPAMRGRNCAVRGTFKVLA